MVPLLNRIELPERNTLWAIMGKFRRHPQGKIISPLEVSPDDLLVTPPSHFKLQKVRDFVVG